jgi:hypothetical protein
MMVDFIHTPRLSYCDENIAKLATLLPLTWQPQKTLETPSTEVEEIDR